MMDTRRTDSAPTHHRGSPSVRPSALSAVKANGEQIEDVVASEDGAGL